MASIHAYTTAAGKRRYLVAYRTPDRKSTTKRGFRNKPDAELFRASVEVSKARGEYVDATAARATIGPLGAEWLKRQVHLKPSSYRSLESAWRIHVLPRWGSVPVADVRLTDVKTWVAELSKAKGPTTVARAYGVLAAVLDDAVADRRVLTNPARGVKLPRKTKAEHRYLTHEQVHDLAAKAAPHSTLILVLAYCGLRWGEATGLRKKDVDLEKHRLRVAQNAVEVGNRVVIGTPKTHERRTVPFPAFLTAGLTLAVEDLNDDDLVFTARSGGHLRRGNAKDGWFVRAARACDLEGLTPHGLRHTAASLAVSAGANVKAVQKMLGHASAAMTLDVYADLFDEDLDAVATALDEAVSRSGVVTSLSRGAELKKLKARNRLDSNDSGPSAMSGDGGI